MKTKVKICGITNIEDAIHICNAGTDAIGLVFYKKSPRNVSIDQAAKICNILPPFVSSVGLFLDASSEFVNSVLASVPLDLLQFHGSESPSFCSSFKRPYIKAVGMKNIKNEAEFSEYADQFPDAKGFLVDSHDKGKAGGTGETFNWDNVPQNYHQPIILAGGLNPDNVVTALKQVSVYAIDLSSGVESEPGKKDKDKVSSLFKNLENS